MNIAQSICYLQRSRLALRVDAGRGARVLEFSLDGRNALATDRPETGSTFWPSPQQAWHWPPPAALDEKPYRALMQGDCIELASDVCPQTQLRITKHFELLEDRLRVTYRMTNASDEHQYWAPWEITRISGGISFYQSGESVLANSSAAVEYANGCVWHEYRPRLQSGENQKMFGNGSGGWLANVNDNLLLVKSFRAVHSADVAPGEAEVEVYAHGDCDRAYIELEQQGPYTQLAPQQTLAWQVIWILSELPSEFDCSVGSNDLTEAVHALLASRALDC